MMNYLLSKCAMSSSRSSLRWAMVLWQYSRDFFLKQLQTNYFSHDLKVSYKCEVLKWPDLFRKMLEIKWLSSNTPFWKILIKMNCAIIQSVPNRAPTSPMNCSTVQFERSLSSMSSAYLKVISTSTSSELVFQLLIECSRLKYSNSSVLAKKLLISRSWRTTSLFYMLDSICHFYESCKSGKI